MQDLEERFFSILDGLPGGLADQLRAILDKAAASHMSELGLFVALAQGQPPPTNLEVSALGFASAWATGGDVITNVAIFEPNSPALDQVCATINASRQPGDDPSGWGAFADAVERSRAHRLRVVPGDGTEAA